MINAWMIVTKEMLLNLIATATLMGLVVVTVGNAQSLVTDRPDQTESALSVPPGVFQFESGVTINQSERAGLIYEDISLPELLVRVGIVDRIEIRFGFGHTVSQVRLADCGNLPCPDFGSISGIDRPSLGGKIALASSEDSKSNFALLTTIVIPVETKLDEETHLLPEARLLYGRDFVGGQSIGANLGVAIDEREDVSLLYTLAIGNPISESLGSFFELFGEFSPALGPSHSASAGLTFATSDKVQFDLAGSFGLTQYAVDRSITVGFSFAFEAFKRGAR